MSMSDDEAFLNQEISKDCQLGNVNKIKAFLKKKPSLISAKDIEGNTLLILACRDNRRKIVDLLLDPPYSADVNQTNQIGYSPLITAATEGHLSVVELLLIKGANINQQNANGWTALMCACCFRRYEIVEKLLQAFADVNIVSNTGCTALYLACSAGNEKIVEILLQFHANPNICSHSGCSPLHLAVEYNQKMIIQLLIDYDANISALDHQDRTPVQVAKTEEMRKFIRSTYQEAIEHPKPKRFMPPRKPPRTSLKAGTESDQNTTENTISNPPSPFPNSPLSAIETPTKLAESSSLSFPTLLESTANHATSVDSRRPDDFGDLIKQLSTLNYDNLQYLSQTSSSSLQYLTDLSSKALSLQYEWKYIQSQPFLAEYYSYSQRCFTSVILSLQVLLSDNIADNRTSLTESTFIALDAVANASGVNALPLVTGLVRYLVHIPYAMERKRTIENISIFFPSVSSHHLIDLLVHEMTLLEEKNIREIMKMNKTIKKMHLIQKLYENHQLVSWMYEEVKKQFLKTNLAGPSSALESTGGGMEEEQKDKNRFAYTIIQAYADIHISRILTRLMHYHHTPDAVEEERKRGGLEERKKNLNTEWPTEELLPLRRQEVTKDTLWQLECFALDYPLSEGSKKNILDNLAMIHDTFNRKRYEEESMKSSPISKPLLVGDLLSSSKATPIAGAVVKARPDSLRYQDIIQSLEEKIGALQEQLEKQQSNSNKLTSQQQQEIQIMKEQLQQVSHLQQLQQQQQQTKLPASPLGGSFGASSRAGTSSILHLQKQQQQQSQSTPSPNKSTEPSQREDENIIDTQTRLIMQQAFMTQTLYEVIQQLQLIQEQLPTSSSKTELTAINDEGKLEMTAEEGYDDKDEEQAENAPVVATRGCCILI